MRLLEATPTRLLFRQSPWVALLVGGIFLLGPGGLLLGSMIAGLCRGDVLGEGIGSALGFLACPGAGLLVMAACGAWIVASAGTVYYLFDRAAGLLTVERTRVLSGRRHFEEFPLADITGAVVIADDDTYGVELRFRSRPPLSLSPVLSSGQQAKQDVARRINAFLPPALLPDPAAQAPSPWERLGAQIRRVRTVLTAVPDVDAGHTGGRSEAGKTGRAPGTAGPSC
jgi:hypothetical protein